MKYESEEAEFRIKALAGSIDEDPEDIEDEGDNRFSVGKREYLVLTDEEADEEAKEYIENSLWAFNPSFLCDALGLPHLAEEMISGFCEAKCEDANDTILAMLGGKYSRNFEALVEDAINTDGRGHFMNSYDGNEDEVHQLISGIPGDDAEYEWYYIYRTN